MLSVPTCNVCCRRMEFVRTLKFDDGLGSYNLFGCTECSKTQAIELQLSKDDKSEFARVSLEVMRILQSMPIDELRQLVVELKANRHKMN